MQSYENWAKYVKGLFAGATIFFLALTILFLLQIRTGVNPLLWFTLAIVCSFGFFLFHIINERIAIAKLTGFRSRKELQEYNGVTFLQYKKDCDDESLAEFVLQEMKFLKNDIKRYIFLRELSLKLKEIKASKQK